MNTDADFIIVPGPRGSGKTSLLTQRLRDIRFKDDPHDMEVLEEVKELRIKS